MSQEAKTEYRLRVSDDLDERVTRAVQVEARRQGRRRISLASFVRAAIERAVAETLGGA